MALALTLIILSLWLSGIVLICVMTHAASRKKYPRKDK